jgi:PD-(D/E)XK nuclease superfamily
MTRPNLFQFATSELSQDAFLCWLLAWADVKYAVDDRALHEAGRKLIAALLAKHNVRIDAPSNVKILRQHSRVDLVAIIDDRLLLLIEDKVHAGVHGDQLTRYAADLVNQFPHCRVLPIFFKTGDQADYEDIEKAGYRTFLRRDVLDVLQSERGNVNNAIFQDFLAELESLEALVASYATLHVPEWSWESWKGFYKQLQTEIPKLRWAYVPNQSGGFMGAWWHSSRRKAARPGCRSKRTA